MNHSSLSVTDNSQSSALLKTAGSTAKQKADDVAESSESFLSKLGKLFSSDGKVSSGDKAVKSSEVAEPDAGEIKKLAVEGEGIDAVSELDTASADKKPQAEDGEAMDGEITDAGPAPDSQSVQSAAGQQAMKNGNELLERLDEANQALQTDSGKELPLQAVKQVADPDAVADEGAVRGETSKTGSAVAENSLMSEEAAGTQAVQKGAEAGNIRLTGAGQAASEHTTDTQIPKALRRWLNVGTDAEIKSQQGAEDVLVRQTGALDGTIQPEGNNSDTTWQAQTESMSQGEQLNSVMIQGKEVDPRLEGKEQAPAVTSLVWGEQQATGEAEVGLVPAGQQSELPDNISPEQLAALQAEAEAKSGDTDWSQFTQASIAADAGKGAVELNKLQLEQTAVQQHQRAHLAQQLPQHQHAMLQEQQAAAEKAAQLQSASPTQGQTEWMAANMSSLQSEVSANKAGNIQGMAASIGINGSKGLSADKAGDRKEADLAHQLASMAGQQGPGQMQRSEAQQVAATQTQSALQLNRDMAGDQLAERVQMMMSKNLKNIDIRLDPPELGRMHIRMTMHGDGASVQFTVANHQARDMVEQAMPRLREMLSQQGVQLADTSVQQQNSGQQRQFMAGNGSGGGSGMSGQSGEEPGNLDESINLNVNIAAKDDGISYYA
ncbi:hypothetical protein DI392_02150 [Vibrio albus]|uniref:Flagellar hook-length control protein-like C-terminal domain-containing protein n=1 Tax=Vibrio albus TaxID=2200953 RepID=A0A2U3BEB0_9VIBR|nr:flagellar hook-length control protein FliK [Vibrio albus]PWI35103.1 hypothetical protein DI392_02150 [Vibrio albus]